MALPIRRGSRFPASLFEPTALWDPVSEFDYLRERMGRLYEQISQQGPEQSPWQPDIEVDETEEFYLVKAELPGITRDNVELQVDEHSLAITGSLREDEVERMDLVFARVDAGQVLLDDVEGLPAAGADVGGDGDRAVGHGSPPRIGGTLKRPDSAAGA